MELEKTKKGNQKRKTRQTYKTKTKKQKQFLDEEEEEEFNQYDENEEEEKIEIEPQQQQNRRGTRQQQRKEKNQREQEKKLKRPNYCELSEEEEENDDDFMENEDENYSTINQKKQKKQTKKQKEKAKQVKQDLSHMDYKQARVQRAKTERIFLLRADRESEDEWSFTVQGQSGKIYLVTVSREKLRCRCMDCALRRRTCKHLLFIVAKIAMSDKILNSMTTNLKLNDQQYNKLDMALMQRLQRRLKGFKQKKEKKKEEEQEDKQQIDLGDDTDCPICFDPMEDEPLAQCVGGCKKYIHKVCIDAWLDKNQNCPLCRADWEADDEYDDDDLDQQAEDDFVADKKNKYGGAAMKKLQVRNITINKKQ